MSPAPAGTCWCGGDLDPTSVRGVGFTLLRCSGCACYRIDPPPIFGEEQSGEFYTAYYASWNKGQATSGGDRLSRYWRVARRVPLLAAASGTAVDFGSGDGSLCHELATAGWRDVIGVDVSRSRVARARRRYPGIRFYDRPLPQTDLAPASVDLCVMDNVIEHLPEPHRTVADLKPFLRPDANLVVITPNMESGIFRLLGRRWTPEIAPHAHVYLFTEKSLTLLLTRAGFKVWSVGSVHDECYPVSAWMSRLLSGDVKGAVWRAHQELGHLYGRILGAGPMLYAVATAPAVTSEPAGADDRPLSDVLGGAAC
jgi:2-polyprenyl-3-methyl-5-hydroxy-6-metoxy-1,4-benzoquinol methylase